MQETIKYLEEEQELLALYDKGDKDLATWEGPGWYYQMPDYHWYGPFITKDEAQEWREKEL